MFSLRTDWRRVAAGMGLLLAVGWLVAPVAHRLLEHAHGHAHADEHAHGGQSCAVCHVLAPAIALSGSAPVVASLPAVHIDYVALSGVMLATAPDVRAVGPRGPPV